MGGGNNCCSLKAYWVPTGILFLDCLVWIEKLHNNREINRDDKTKATMSAQISLSLRRVSMGCGFHRQ